MNLYEKMLRFGEDQVLINDPGDWTERERRATEEMEEHLWELVDEEKVDTVMEHVMNFSTEIGSILMAVGMKVGARLQLQLFSPEAKDRTDE